MQWNVTVGYQLSWENMNAMEFDSWIPTVMGINQLTCSLILNPQSSSLIPHPSFYGFVVLNWSFYTTVTIMTGCSSIPQPNSKFCFDHADGQHPVVPGDRVSARKRLRKFKKAECTEAEDDDFFIIESVLDIKDNKKTGKKYKIKWMSLV